MKKIFVFFTIFGLLFGLTGVILAQEQPEIPSGAPAGVETGPQPGEIPSGLPEGINAGPPEDIEMGPQNAHPKMEIPGLPSEAGEMLQEKDLAEIYCLFTRWKSGEFLAMLDAMKQDLLPAIEKVKEMGIELDVPNVDAMKAEAESKIDAVCLASGVDGANAAIAAFENFALSTDSTFRNLEKDMSNKLTAKGKEMENRVNDQINPIVEAEKTKMNAEIQEYADGLSAEFQNTLNEEMGGQQFTSAEGAQAYAMSRVAAFESDIQNKIKIKVDEKKAALQSIIEAKVNEIIGTEKATFENIGNIFEDMGTKINATIAQNKAPYEKYKTEAFAKRKQVILDLVDKNISSAKEEMEKNTAQFEEAKKSNPSAKTIDEILAEMEADKNALSARLDQAMQSENEAAIQAAIDDFQKKWSNYRSETEKSFLNTKTICKNIREQFAIARPQIEQGNQKVKDTIGRCAGKSDDTCLKINELTPRFSTILNKNNNIINQMSGVLVTCDNALATNLNIGSTNIMSVLEDIKKTGEEAKAYGEALEAEKAQAEALALSKASEACKQALPQIKAGRIELAEYSADFRAKIASCSGKATTECAVVNKLADEIKTVLNGTDSLSKDMNELEKRCLTLKQTTPLEEIGKMFQEFSAKKDEINLVVKSMKYNLSRLDNAAYACEGAMPLMESSARDFGNQLQRMRDAVKSCRDKKTDPAVCARVANLSDKMNQVEAIYKKYSTTYYALKKKCEEASRRSGGQAVSGNEMPTSEVLDLIKQMQKIQESALGLGMEIESIAMDYATWRDLIKSGKSFRVIFDAATFNDAGWTGATDPMGTLKAGETYIVSYTATGNNWSVRGFNEKTNSTGFYNYTNYSPVDYKLNLWGRVYTFNEKGEVIDKNYGLVGHLIK